MSNFHLRPVSDKDRSASPSTSTSTTSDRSPRDSKRLPGLPPSQVVLIDNNQPRRPLSSTCLRDLDLSRDTSMQPRKYPAPPTGHELMALFPPAPPINVLSGPTSDFFQREERAFFAKAGKEIVRVRIELDLPLEGDVDSVMKSKPREHSGMPRQWPPNGHPHNPTNSPSQLSPSERPPAGQFPPPPSGARGSRGAPVTVTTQPLFPINSHPSPQPPFPPNSNPQHPAFGLRTPSHEHTRSPNQMEHSPEEFRDDDESWRRPMPHNQRRRAGKHTKRVVVKS